MKIDKKSSKVLVVDDNPVNIDFLVELLKEYDVRTVLDGISALEAIEEERPDAILLDISMPKMNGFELCEKLKSSNKTKDIPVIFLTANHDTKSIVHAFEVGGVDYISKPYNTQEVLVRLQTHLKLKKALELLAHGLYYDDLTGVPNRKKFFKDSQKWIKRAQMDMPFHLHVLTVAHFNDFNKEYGYEVGDYIIKAIAMIVQKVVKIDYTLSRFGGAEFFLVFHHISEEESDKWVEAIKNASQKVKLRQYPELKFTIKAGSTTSLKSDETIKEMIKRAHKAQK